MSETRFAVVTGASAGIGAATARALAKTGFRVLIGARREDRLRSLATEIDGEYRRLDVTDPASVTEFTSGLDRVDVLINNAGGALGLDLVQDAPEDRWQEMWELNFMSTVRMTKALLPALRASGDGLIVNVGSIAGFETYRNGGGYTAAKHAVRALTRTLRLELLGEPIRVSETPL